MIHISYAAAAAKSLQSCPTLCDPMDCNPPGSSIHGIFQARVLEWGAIAAAAAPPNSLQVPVLVPQAKQLTTGQGYILTHQQTRCLKTKPRATSEHTTRQG